MHAAALPGGAEDPADRRFQPFMGIRDHQLDPAQASSRQALQKARPEGFGLRRADVQPNDLASAIGVDCHSDYRGHRDDAAALALLQVGGVEPQIRPLAGERPIEEGMDANNRRLFRFYREFCLHSDRSAKDASRAGERKLARLARGPVSLLRQHILASAAGYDVWRAGAPTDIPLS